MKNTYIMEISSRENFFKICFVLNPKIKPQHPAYYSSQHIFYAIKPPMSRHDFKNSPNIHADHIQIPIHNVYFRRLKILFDCQTIFGFPVTSENKLSSIWILSHRHQNTPILHVKDRLASLESKTRLSHINLHM